MPLKIVFKEMTACPYCGSRHVQRLRHFSERLNGDDGTDGITLEAVSALCLNCYLGFNLHAPDLQQLEHTSSGHQLLRRSRAGVVRNASAEMIKLCEATLKAQDRVLVLGGSSGQLAFHLAAAGAVSVTAVDAQLEFKSQGSVHAYRRSFNDDFLSSHLEFKTGFDLIILDNVLTTAPDLSDLLSSCAYCLKDGGHIVLESSAFAAEQVLQYQRLSPLTLDTICSDFNLALTALNDAPDADCFQAVLKKSSLSRSLKPFFALEERQELLRSALALQDEQHRPHGRS